MRLGDYIDCFLQDSKCFIGLRHSCNYCEPTSGVYFNDLTGMSLKRLSTAAGEENHTAEKLFKKLHDRAIEIVVGHLTGGLSKEFHFNHTIQKRKIGKTGKEFNDYKPKKGIYLERYSDDCFQSLRVGKVSFKYRFFIF